MLTPDQIMNTFTEINKRLAKLEKFIESPDAHRILRSRSREDILGERMLEMIASIQMMNGWTYQTDMRERSGEFALHPNQFKNILERLITDNLIEKGRNRHPVTSTMCNTYRLTTTTP